MSAEMIDTYVLKTAEERRRAEILRTVIISAVRPCLGQVYLSLNAVPCGTSISVTSVQKLFQSNINVRAVTSCFLLCCVRKIIILALLLCIPYEACLEYICL